MADYPYVKVVGNLKRFMRHIQSSGVPQTLTQKTLASMGFKSINDRKIIPAMKFIGFLHEDGMPSDLWRRYRDKRAAPFVLGEALITGYKDLFDLYPDAHERSSDDLRDFFSARTDVGQQAVTAMVSTFKALCELAAFDGDQPLSSKSESLEQTVPSVPPSSEHDSLPLRVAGMGGLSLNINVELHLPATQDGAVYDKLFESLRKHLLRD